MKILNLGSGTKTSNHPNVVNIDWTIYLRIKRSRLLSMFAPLFIRGERLKRFRSLDNNVMVYNLAKGIPFDAGSVDVVYHSHLLEHLDKNVALKFLVEVKRVLKPGGIHRIVVPDLEIACRNYITSLTDCAGHSSDSANHDSYIAKIIEQSVRKEASGTSQQSSVRRIVENTLLGDARRRGETHQWMYDRINLKQKLIDIGYRDVSATDFNKSQIPNWSDYGLDIDEYWHQYKNDSLYMEAKR